MDSTVALLVLLPLIYFYQLLYYYSVAEINLQDHNSGICPGLNRIEPAEHFLFFLLLNTHWRHSDCT